MRKKTDRYQNSYHRCLFCDKLSLHVPSHVLIYKDKPEAQEVLELVNRLSRLKPEEKSQREELIQRKTKLTNKIRAKGNHQHNIKVITERKGELIILGRPKDKFNHEDFGPCPKCFEWMLKSSLIKHQKTCSSRKEDTTRKSKSKKKDILLQTDIIAGRLPKEGSSLFKQEVFKIMKIDAIGKSAKSDLLIIILGESWFRRNIDNETKRKYYSSSRMRMAAKLLLYLREEEKEENLALQQETREDVVNKKQI